MVADARKRPKTRHEQLIKRMRERIAMNERSGRVTDMSRRDYRWWQALKAGIPVNQPKCYEFWCELHWQTRELYINRLSLLTISEQDRDACAEESKEFFRKALENPKLERERERRCDILRHR
jgi:hypothetical protein